jgi:hypothetical protein
MKEPSATSRSPLGHLAAFTLGIICMGAIMFFTSRTGMNQSPAGKDSAPQPGSAERGKSHFQRASSSTEAPVPPPYRGTLRHPADLKAPQVATAPEATAPEEIVPAPQPNQTIVHQPVTVVADRAVLAADVHRNTPQLSGRVFLIGQRPPERVLPLDPQCARKHPGPVTTRFYVTGKDNGLADVLVTISAGLPRKNWPVPRQSVTLRLRGCIYENHIVGVQTDQKLTVANLDNIGHNVHNMPQRNPEKNLALFPRARELEYKFTEPELFMRFKCDVHPWEFAYVNVIEHPFFAINDSNGNFAINGLPPGKYTLQANHRKAGLLQKEITVEQDRNIEINFEFKAPPAHLEI